MSWEIKFSSQSTKFIRKLQDEVKQRVKDKFIEISNNPFHYLEQYEGDYYKIRIGDYRALIDIDFERKILFVRVFDKRGRIYK